jgi:hypothetical protein
METRRSVVFFGDASRDPSEAVDRLLLALREGSLVSKFIHAVHKALQEECVKLSTSERAGIPPIDDVHRLLKHSPDGASVHPAIHAAKVVVIQLGSFLG